MIAIIAEEPAGMITLPDCTRKSLGSANIMGYQPLEGIVNKNGTGKKGPERQLSFTGVERSRRPRKGEHQ